MVIVWFYDQFIIYDEYIGRVEIIFRSIANIVFPACLSIEWIDAIRVSVPIKLDFIPVYRWSGTTAKVVYLIAIP